MNKETLAVLMFALFPLAAWADSDPVIRVTAESLASFQLISVSDEPEPEPEPKPPPPEATALWKWLGYGLYGCAIVAPSSVEYRKSQSEWTPPINNTPSNYATWFATSISMNSLSDWQRRSERSDIVAIALRAGSLAACAFASAENFQKGADGR